MSDSEEQVSRSKKPNVFKRKAKNEEDKVPLRNAPRKKEEENEQDLMAKYLIDDNEEEKGEDERDRSRNKKASKATKVKKIKEQEIEVIKKKQENIPVANSKQEQQEGKIRYEDEKISYKKEEPSAKYSGDLNAEEYFLAKQAQAKVEKIQFQYSNMTAKERKIFEKQTREEAVRILNRIGMSSNKMASTYKLGNDYLNYLIDMEKTVQDMREAMNCAYIEDVKAIETKKMAYHRIRLLPQIAKVLQTQVGRQYFMINGGFEQLTAWILPIPHPTLQDIQPCLAIKMGVLRIIKELNLNADEITEHGTKAHTLIDKNKKVSKIYELKELCREILKDWDFTMFNELQQRTVPPSSDGRSITIEASLN